MSTRTIIAFSATAFVAALVVLAAFAISAGTIPLARTDAQGVKTEPATVPTEAGPSSLPTQAPRQAPTQAPTQVPTQAPTPSPETALQEGQLFLQTRCTKCHELQWLLQVKKTRAEWEKTLLEMGKSNVTISDAERNALLDYLTSVDKP